MMHSTLRKIAFTLTAFAIATGSALAQERLRIAGNFAADHSSSIAMQQFKKERPEFVKVIPPPAN